MNQTLTRWAQEHFGSGGRLWLCNRLSARLVCAHSCTIPAPQCAISPGRWPSEEFLSLWTYGSYPGEGARPSWRKFQHLWSCKVCLLPAHPVPSSWWPWASIPITQLWVYQRAVGRDLNARLLWRLLRTLETCCSFCLSLSLSHWSFLMTWSRRLVANRIVRNSKMIVTKVCAITVSWNFGLPTPSA